MGKDSSFTARVIPWDDDHWGVFVEYGYGSWRRYVVGSREDADRELARLVFDQREREDPRQVRVCIRP